MLATTHYCLAGVEAIKNLLIKALLPDERRLRFFHQHPLDKVYLTLMVSVHYFSAWYLRYPPVQLNWAQGRSYGIKNLIVLQKVRKFLAHE